MPYVNFRGLPMPESATPTSNVYGTNSGGETLTAPAGPSAVDSGGGPNDLLIGSSGDNIFYIRDGSDRVQVGAGLPGVKSIVAYTSYALPANVQNLSVSGNFSYAVGNALPNLIVGQNGPEQLYGAAGDDVLVGAGNGTSFIVAAGEGNDAIYNFSSSDTVRLIGSNFRSFAEVQGAMRQAGADVVLQINPSETLTIRNVSAGQLTSNNFLLPLDRSQLGAVTFNDDFNSLQLYNPATGAGLWRPNFGSDPTQAANYQLPQNGEQQVYTAPDFQGTAGHPLGYNPFSVSGGVLTITAEKLAPQDSPLAFGATYSSGLLATRGIFEQKYGYFETRMAIPEAKGTWPAFWMVPDPNGRGIEADIAENIAIDTRVDHVRAYDGQIAAYADALKIGDPRGFHTYGMLWTPQTVTFYYDDVAVYRAPTPAGWTDPMYMIVNMAIGGYGGPPDPGAFPASMQVDYVRAYALGDGSTVVTGGQDAPLYGTAGPDNLIAPASGGWLQGLAGADTLVGSAAQNTLMGGDGADSILGGANFNRVNGNTGDDVIVGRSASGDWLLGGQGADRIDASQSHGHNILNGNIGADTVIGGPVGDTLRGGQDNDLIIGGAGPDWISGDRGTDTITGGGGADSFHQSPGGTSIVTDFNLAQGDRVLLDHGSQYSAQQSGTDVMVSLTGGGQLILQQTQLSSLNGAWIVVA